MGMVGVITWLIGVINLLTKSPITLQVRTKETGRGSCVRRIGP